MIPSDRCFTSSSSHVFVFIVLIGGGRQWQKQHYCEFILTRLWDIINCFYHHDQPAAALISSHQIIQFNSQDYHLSEVQFPSFKMCLSFQQNIRLTSLTQKSSWFLLSWMFREQQLLSFVWLWSSDQSFLVKITSETSSHVHFPNKNIIKQAERLKPPEDEARSSSAHVEK